MKDFFRNLTYDKRYDENSFIGILLDYLEWSDEEYLKLENDLIYILKKYKNKPLPKKLMRGLVWILNGNLYTHGTGICKVKKKYKNIKQNKYFTPISEPTIEDRLRKLKTLILCIAYNDDTFFYRDFLYSYDKK
ncbi:Imm41 family immunity protein [Campylobacter majalis]|uniref:Imm41 family immunity protein n=1 Tax=Campylobacter majalis TaxID=2790656 RepID=UPI003D69AF89